MDVTPTFHRPFSYDVGPLEITGFGLAVLLGFVIGQIIGRRELTRRGFDPEPVGDIVFAAVIGFLIGARIYYAILVGDASALWGRAGFVFWGGLAGGVAAGLWMARRRGMPLMRICDVAGIGIAAGYAVGRTGCFAVGDDYGRPWNSPFAVAFPEGAPPSTAANMQAEFGVPVPEGVSPDTVLAVHPTQLYETALGFIMFAILWRMRAHRHAEGWLFGAYLLLAGVERFAIEFLRAKDDRFFAGLTLAQIIAMGMIAAGAVWMWARRGAANGGWQMAESR